jgi:hypothetical protein
MACCVVAGLSAPVGCASEESGGTGSRGPSDLEALDTPATTILREFGEDGELLRFNPSQLRVREDLTLVFSNRIERNGRDGFADETVDEVRDVVYAFDYGTGRARELVRVPTEGRLALEPPGSMDGALHYYATIAENAESMRVTGLDARSGASTFDTIVDAVYGNCFMVAGGDLYFDPDGLSVAAARNIDSRERITTLDPIGGRELCRGPENLASLDGTAVLVQAPTRFDPMVETIRLVALDPLSGIPEPTPLLSIPVSSVSLGTENERPPILSLEDDGLYVLATDFVSMEVWFVPYDRRPGEASASGSNAEPERLARIEVPFFAEVIPTEGGLAIFDPRGFEAVDGVVALTVRIEESAGSSRFFWGFLVMIDTQNERYDLLLFSNATAGLVDMIPTVE